MSTQELSETTALVTGASRGFGRAIAIALSKHGAHVVGVARDRARLEELRAQLGGTFTPVAADAADPVVAGLLLDEHRPRTLVLNAGAAPLPRPIHRQTWQTFSRNWEVDVQQVFNWTREALLLPMEPGSVVVAFSSGAAVNGSPLSGGYAGAKATIRPAADLLTASFIWGMGLTGYGPRRYRDVRAAAQGRMEEALRGVRQPSAKTRGIPTRWLATPSSTAATTTSTGQHPATSAGHGCADTARLSSSSSCTSPHPAH